MTEPAAPAGHRDWSWLAGTYWYCPPDSMPALQAQGDATFAWMLDQTVWKITGARDGYFWGVASALLTPVGEEPDPTDKADLTLYGSITPASQVHITFIRSARSTTIGTGEMTEHRGEPAFLMQMSSGPATALAVHWAYMIQVAPGDPAWESLPGVGISVPEMVDDLEPPEPAEEP